MSYIFSFFSPSDNMFQESKAPFRCFELTKGFQRALVATATAAIILVLVCVLLKPTENKVKGKLRSTFFIFHHEMLQGVPTGTCLE